MPKKDGWFDPKYNINRKSKSISASGRLKKEIEKTQINEIDATYADQKKTPSIKNNGQKNKICRISLLENALEEIIFEEAGLNFLKREIGALKNEGCRDIAIRKLKEHIFTQRLKILQKIVNMVKYYEQKFPPDPLNSKTIKKLKAELEEKNELLSKWAHRIQKIWNKAFGHDDRLDKESIDIKTC
ncbi:MAG: hypothetical protein GF383_13325 [Candidatus Lokiarchaeota archaeon]|nr:hypothetical protein [Candidatus Lokiarchaeota archaeon]MBD3342172.1 hypothetical protein [Candidatus Lokiarchaeota archaeon]